MRAAHLWPAALVLTACAHTARSTESSNARTLAVHAQQLNKAAPQESQRPDPSPDILERAHPEREISELERPPAAEAKGPRTLGQDAGVLSVSAPPPHATGRRIEAAIDPTHGPASVPVPPASPADSKVVAAPLRDAPQPPPPELGAEIARADAELRERVQRALLDTPSLSYTAQHVHVAVSQRHVTLRGEVRNAYERGELERLVRGLPGVKALDSQVALINPPTVPRRR